LAKQKPGQIAYGSSGIGSGTHFAAELFNLTAGISVVHVPYRGSPEVLNDVIAGRLQFAMTPVLVAVPLVRSGRVLAIGVTSRQRLPMVQDVPPIAEGLPGFEYDGWFGALAPARTPRAIVNKLSREIGRILQLPDVIERITSTGALPRSSTPEEFDKLVRTEIAMRTKGFKAAGAKAEGYQGRVRHRSWVPSLCNIESSAFNGDHMMYSCAPRDAAASRSTTRGKNIKRGGKTLAVDLHCHVHTPAADEIAGKSEKQTDPTARYGNQRTAEHQKKLREELDRKLTSVEQRLADMDKMGVDVQAISTSPLQYYYGVEPDLGRQIARKINERLAEIQGGHPDRFAALGTLPMQAPELAVTE